MTDRERLIELLSQPMMVTDSCDKEMIAKAYADRILSDGWIRPPCKVGDKLYYLRTWHSGRKTIHPFEAPDWDWIMEHLNDFGKTIFTSRKEVEKALKGGNNNGNS